MSLTVDVRAREKSVEEIETQLMLTEQSLQSLAADQRTLISDAQTQVKYEQRQQIVAHLATQAQRRSPRLLIATAFGGWSGAVKSKLETAMVEAIQLLQTQVSAFEEELSESKVLVKELEAQI